jgi:preprotein translocase subunit YajC
MSFLLAGRRWKKDRAMRHLTRWAVPLLLTAFALPLLRADDKNPPADPKPGAQQNKPEAKAADPKADANKKDDAKAPAGDGPQAGPDKADDQKPAGQREQPPFGGLLPLVPLLLLLFYLIVIRPQSRRQEAERLALKTLKKGDKVLTHSGIYGTVVGVSETENEITVKVDDNTRLRMTKESIARNLRAEEEAKAAREKPKEGAA